MIHVSLSLALVGRDRYASRPGRFTPRKRDPDTHWIKCWMGPKSGDTEKLKFFTLPGLELRSLGRPARSQSIYLLRYRGSYHGLL
jgi:hypothetical protein